MVGLGFVTMMVQAIYKVLLENLIFIMIGLLLNTEQQMKVLILYGELEMIMAFQ